MEQEVIVVTGAAAGVGRAVAREFAQPGRAIALLARDTEGLQNARREVEQRGAKGLAIPVDMADPDQVEAAAQQIERELGPPDIWVNDAMTTIFSPLVEITPAEFKRATEVTYLGTVYGTMSALKRMYPRNKGSIVQVGSALSYRSIPLQSPYCGAKFAIRGFTDSLRTELIHQRKNIRITMVQLPAVNTPQFTWCRTRLPKHPEPVPPIYQPEVPARAIVHAAYHWRREWCVGASTVMAVMGSKFIPGLLDHYLAGKRAWEGQETGQPVSPQRPDNLFEPVPGDYGAHGIFDDKARPASWQWWLSVHRDKLLAGAVAAGLSLVAALWGSRERKSAPSRGWRIGRNHSSGDGANKSQPFYAKAAERQRPLRDRVSTG